MEFRTKIVINASAETVFNTICQAENFVLFDPNCIRIDGEIKKGNYIKAHSKLNPGRAFKVRVSELKAPESMVWEGGMPFNLFKGVRIFSVIAKDDRTTEFHMVETFSGPLLNLFKNSIPDMTEAFKQFSKGLKKYKSR